MNRATAWAAQALALILASGCQPTPEEDLEKLGTAIQKADSAEAIRYLDVERTAETFVNDILALSMKESDTTKKSDQASELGKQMGEAMVRMMQPAIEKMVKRGVYDLIGGRPIHVFGLSGSAVDTVSRDSILKLKPRALATQTFGDTAVVSLEIDQRDQTAPETLRVRMEHPKDVWRVVRIEGLDSAILKENVKRK